MLLLDHKVIKVIVWDFKFFGAPNFSPIDMFIIMIRTFWQKYNSSNCLLY